MPAPPPPASVHLLFKLTFPQTCPTPPLITQLFYYYFSSAEVNVPPTPSSWGICYKLTKTRDGANSSQKDEGSQQGGREGEGFLWATRSNLRPGAGCSLHPGAAQPRGSCCLKPRCPEEPFPGGRGGQVPPAPLLLAAGMQGVMGQVLVAGAIAKGRRCKLWLEPSGRWSNGQMDGWIEGGRELLSETGARWGARVCVHTLARFTSAGEEFTQQHPTQGNAKKPHRLRTTGNPPPTLRRPEPAPRGGTCRGSWPGATLTHRLCAIPAAPCHPSLHTWPCFPPA